MAITSIQAGSITTDGSEQTIGSVVTDDAAFTGYLDMTNSTSGETIVIKIKVRISGTSDIVMIKDTFVGAQDEPLYHFPPITSSENFTWTVEKTGGTNRAYTYRLYQVV
jgi:hypothetical protein|tara:strand:- start:443 stop:769 length:327 start_codon:yes stop_codon:yes gene_type:complete